DGGITYLEFEKHGVCSVSWTSPSTYRQEQWGTGTYSLDWWQTKSGEKRPVLRLNIRTPPEAHTKGKGTLGFAIEVVSVTDSRLVIRTDFGGREQGGGMQEIALDRR